MPSKEYIKGVRFERRCQALFATLGYLCFRSPGSRSPFDLIVCGHGHTILVQCKINRNLPAKPWNELFDLAKKVGGRALFARRVGRKIVIRELIGWKDGDTNWRNAPDVLLDIEELRCVPRGTSYTPPELSVAAVAK